MQDCSNTMFINSLVSSSCWYITLCEFSCDLIYVKTIFDVTITIMQDHCLSHYVFCASSKLKYVPDALCAIDNRLFLLGTLKFMC